MSGKAAFIPHISGYYSAVFLMMWYLAVSQCTGIMDGQNSTDFSRAVNESLLLDQKSTEWENVTLAGPMLVNRLSQLTVLASRPDVNLMLPPGYQMKYINQTSSLRGVVQQLTLSMQVSLQRTHIEYNRLQLTMKKAPALLLDTFLIIQTETLDVLDFILGERLNDVSRLVNDSSDTSKSLRTDYSKVHGLIVEIDDLVIYTQKQTGSLFLTEIGIHTKDIRQHSDQLSLLVASISSHSESMAVSFVMQFIWFIQASMQPGINLTPDTRAYILRMLVPKAIDIDRGSDLIAMMMRTFVDVSEGYMLPEIAGSYNQLMLPNDDQRRTYDRRLWKRLAEVSMKVSRLTQIRQAKFVARNSTRSAKYEKFLLTPIAY